MTFYLSCCKGQKGFIVYIQKARKKYKEGQRKIKETKEYKEAQMNLNEAQRNPQKPKGKFLSVRRHSCPDISLQMKNMSGLFNSEYKQQGASGFIDCSNPVIGEQPGTQTDNGMIQQELGMRRDDFVKQPQLGTQRDSLMKQPLIPEDSMASLDNWNYNSNRRTSVQVLLGIQRDDLMKQPLIDGGSVTSLDSLNYGNNDRRGSVQIHTYVVHESSCHTMTHL